MRIIAWKIFLFSLFVITLVHFVKDITQDILMLDTVLNNFGNINEYISEFPEWLVWLYHWAMVNTFFAEILILLFSPMSFFKKRFEIKREERVILVSLVYIVIMFSIAYILQ